MADNVVKFRKLEKKPEPPVRKNPQWPGWLPWVAIVVIALALVLVFNPGVFG